MVTFYRATSWPKRWVSTEVVVTRRQLIDDQRDSWFSVESRARNQTTEGAGVGIESAAPRRD